MGSYYCPQHVLFAKPGRVANPETLQGVTNPKRIGVGLGWGGWAQHIMSTESGKLGISVALGSLASLGSWPWIVLGKSSSHFSVDSAKE